MRILFVCTEFYAGMMPFGSAITNVMEETEHEVFGLFVCSPQCDYRKVITKNNNKNFVFIDTPMQKLARGFFRLFAFPVIREIKKIIKHQKIDAVHLLTEDASLALYLNFIKSRSKVIYTVHDLKKHEAKNGLLKKIIQFLLVERRVSFLIKNISNLVTCSKEQFESLKKLHPGKKIFYHNFPSLVTSEIEKGTKVVPELSNIKNYILFFGRVELYKGVHILYEQYCKSEVLKQHPLVIAGSGEVYFDRNFGKESGVTFINRYIEDAEMNDLLSKAYCLVFPYLSATQSGVVSLAYHFNKPVIVSDIPFFRDCIEEGQSGYLFDINSPDSLEKVFLELKKVNNKSGQYNTNMVKKQLNIIYSSIENFHE